MLLTPRYKQIFIQSRPDFKTCFVRLIACKMIFYNFRDIKQPFADFGLREVCFFCYFFLFHFADISEVKYFENAVCS